MGHDRISQYLRSIYLQCSRGIHPLVRKAPVIFELGKFLTFTFHEFFIQYGFRGKIHVYEFKCEKEHFTYPLQTDKWCTNTKMRFHKSKSFTSQPTQSSCTMLAFNISTLACPQLQNSIQQHYKKDLDLDEAHQISNH